MPMHKTKEHVEETTSKTTDEHHHSFPLRPPFIAEDDGVDNYASAVCRRKGVDGEAQRAKGAQQAQNRKNGVSSDSSFVTETSQN